MALSRVGGSLVDLSTVVRVLDVTHGKGPPDKDAVKVRFQDGDEVEYLGEDAKAWRALIQQVPPAKMFPSQIASE